MRTSLFCVLITASLLVPCHESAGQSLVRGPYLQSPSGTAVTIRWRTDVPSASTVWWGTEPGALEHARRDTTAATEHTVRLDGLLPDTRYYYAVGHGDTRLTAGGDSFSTSPPPGGHRAGRFWVLGDSGFPSAEHAAVRDAYRAFSAVDRTDLILMLGDNAYYDGTDAEFQAALFDMHEEMLRCVPVWSTVGNHEVHTADAVLETGPYYDIFDFPTAGECGGLASGHESYYSFDWGDVHFVCLNSAQGDDAYREMMARWLHSDLASTTRSWIVAFWHHPPYSRGSHDSDTEVYLQKMRQEFVPILESYGVDLVLCGHSHSYERSMLIDGHHDVSTTFDPLTMAVDDGDGRIGSDGAYRKASAVAAPHEGAVYCTMGSTSYLTPGPLDHPVMVSNWNAFGSCIIDVNGAQMDLRFLDDSGDVLDHCTIVKGGVTPVDVGETRVAGGHEVHTFVDEQSYWRHDDSGADLGTAWTSPAYPDAGWPFGQAPLGFGEPIINTQVSVGVPPAQLPVTTYFRTTFQVDDPSALTGLDLDVLYDDGFVAWINGVQVASGNMPSGNIDYLTQATMDHEAQSWEFHDAGAALAVLVPGINVLTVEVHQHVPTNGDLVFDARLIGDRSLEDWSFHDGGVDLGPYWASPLASAPGWQVGPAPLGYGEPYIATQVSFGPDGADRHPTTYFRRTFDAVDDVERLRLSIDYDDGFVAWLNGVEVARSANMPAGPVGWATYATSAHEAGTPEVFDLSQYTGVLAPSGNVLAIEVHQHSGTSSDLVLSAALDLGSGFTPFIGEGRRGNVVDVAGEPVSVLHVNGSDGSHAASVDVRVGEPLTLSVSQPPMNPYPADFMLVARLGTPPLDGAVPIVQGVGTFAFNPFELSVLLANTWTAPLSTVHATPTPWSVGLPQGAPAPVTFTLQGLVSATPFVLRTTNAVRLAVIP